MAIFMESLRKRLVMSRSSLEGDRIKSSIRPLGDQGVLEGGGDRWLEGGLGLRGDLRLEKGE